MFAVALRHKEWLGITESGTSGDLVTPILCHLIDENDNSVMGTRLENLFDASGQAADDILDVVVGFYQFWYGTRHSLKPDRSAK